MALSSDLISQFVEVTKEEKQNKETTVYGTIVVYDGNKYVKLDGSELLTPISTTADAIDGERVTVMIKNHNAIVTGNISSPAARNDTVSELGTKISEFEIVIADKVSVERLEAELANIDTLIADKASVKDLEAIEADIGTLTADNVTINEKLTVAEADIDSLETKKLDVEIADVKYATIENLEAQKVKIGNLESTYGEFKDLTTEKFTAIDANISKLETDKLNATDADLKYANIDFANINMAAVEKLFSDSGIIKDLIVDEGKITGELVGVTIKGDLIEGNTIVADKLVVKGENGLYYKLNVREDGVIPEDFPDDWTEEQKNAALQSGLHGSNIIAQSITAEKISVSDLVAFDATIGGFNITNESIYSGTKSTVDNTTRGIYLDKTGQLAIGDSNSFLKYYKDADGNYKLEISAKSIKITSSSSSGEATSKSVEESINDLQTQINTAKDSIDGMEIGGRNYFSYQAKDFDEDGMMGKQFENGEYTLADYQNEGSFTQFYNLTKPMKEFLGKKIKLSFDCISPNGETSISVYNANNIPRYVFNATGIKSPISTSWVHQELTITVTDKGSDGTTERASNKIEIYCPNQMGCKIRNVKWEIGTIASDWTPAPEDIKAEFIDSDENIRKSILEQTTSITNDCESIIMSALESYVQTGDYETYKGTVSSQLELLASELSIKFTETTSSINNLSASTADQFNTIYKNFTFSDSGITIGGSSGITLTVDNDQGIIFSKNGEQFGLWDGNYFYTGSIFVRMDERAQFGNFAFVPDKTDGSLRFLKVGG